MGIDTSREIRYLETMLPIHRAKFSVYNYDEIPPGYYYEKLINGSPVQKFWHREKFREVATRIRPQDHVLDFGCGPGSFLAILAEELPEVKAVGLDIASGQIDFAMNKIGSQFKDGRISFCSLKGNEKRVPFDDASFDVVTSIEVIEHIHPYAAAKALGEMRRILKPDGRIIITTPNYRSLWPLIEVALEKLSPVKYHEQHISKFTPNSFVKFIESCGFEVVKLNTIFTIAPFLASLSKGLAQKVHQFEKSHGLHIGSLLVAEAKKVNLENLLG